MVRIDLRTQPACKQKLWQDAIAGHFGDADLSIRRPERFTGQISSLGRGPIKLVQVRSDNEIGVRTRRHAAGDTDEVFVIAMVNRGTVEFSQRNRSCVLSDGMVTLFAASEPYLIRHDDPAEVINLTVQSSLLESFLSQPHDRVCRAFDMRGLVGRVSRDLLVGLADSANGDGEISPASLRLALDSMAVLIQEKDAAPPGLTRPQAAMLRRCNELIDAGVSDSALSPQYLAQQMGVSVRHLHALFQRAGTTICEGILAARLARSLRLLEDASGQRARIKEIAFDSGFTNQSYFSAQFRKRYGKTPRQMRAMLTASGQA
jgi:AraC family transcriptional activator of tynA and feaB